MEINVTQNEAHAIRTILSNLTVKRHDGKWEIGVTQGKSVFISYATIEDEEKNSLSILCKKLELDPIREIS